MTAALPVAVAAVAVGLALMAASRAMRGRDRHDDLAEVLGLTRTLPPPTADQDAASGRVARGVVDLAGRAVEHLDHRGSLAAALGRARIPVRPGEYVIITAAVSMSAAALLLVMTHQRLVAGAVLVLSPVVARKSIRRRIAKRRKAFEAQLPGALSLVASSLSAGHTFLRAIQMMCQESEPPLSEEFRRVVAETQLGDPVVEALGRMAERLDVRDLDWVVQAIRIQQTVGGRLAELLHTLADFIRAREEVRREVLVLTAEGRISAYVLGGMVPMLMVAIQVVNPGYVAPLLRGWGLLALGLCAMSVVVGTAVILRMAKIDV